MKNEDRILKDIVVRASKKDGFIMISFEFENSFSDVSTIDLGATKNEVSKRLIEISQIMVTEP